MNRKNLSFIVLCLSLLLCASAIAADCYWDAGGATSIWDDANNWNGDTLPTSADNAYIPNGANVYLDSRTGDEVIYDLYPSYSNESGGMVKINSITLDVYGKLYLGTTADSADGLMYVLNDGVLDINSTSLALKVSGSGQEIKIEDSGEVNVTNGSVVMGNTIDDSTGSSDITINTGGIFDVYYGLYLGYRDNSGTHNVDVNDGTINAARLFIANADDTTSHFQFCRGRVDLTDELRINSTGTRDGSMDMERGAKVIVDGDCVSTLNGYITGGCLTSYDGMGTLSVDYDETNPGRTTVKSDLLSIIAASENTTVTFNNAVDVLPQGGSWSYNVTSLAMTANVNYYIAE
jgi:hypothetical protein